MTTEQSSINVFDDIPCLRPYAAKINEHLGGRRSGEGVLFVRERFKAFAHWARQVERQAEFEGRPRMVLQLPVAPADLAAYARWLDEDQGLALSSIRSYMSAIAVLHVAANIFNSAASAEVKVVLTELTHKHADDPLSRARALSDAELGSILSILHIPRRAKGRRTENPEEARLRANVEKALLLSMIEAGMRRSEAADLTWGKVRENEDGSGIIFLPLRWATNQDEIWIDVTEECMQALKEIKPEGADGSSSVFDLSSSQINRRLKRMCEEARIYSGDISGDTPRATLRRKMIDSKASLDEYTRQLRLKSHRWSILRHQGRQPGNKSVEGD